MPERVSVIVVAFNARDHLRRCLESLRDHDAQSILEVHVGDNASEESVAAMVREDFPEVALHEFAQNRGFAAACNALISGTASPWVLLVNPDTTLQPGAVDALVDFALRNPRGGLYGGRTLRPDGSIDPGSAWGLPSAWSLTCFALGISAAFKFHPWFDPESLAADWDTERPVGAVTGCWLLVRRDTWDGLAGFDERFFLYGEDFDLARRAHDAGLQPMVTPASEIVHHVGGSTPDVGRRRVLVLRGRVTYLEMHWDDIWLRYGKACLWVGAWLRGVAANHVRSWFGRPLDPAWRTAWERRAEWLSGWS